MKQNQIFIEKIAKQEAFINAYEENAASIQDAVTYNEKHIAALDKRVS